MELKQQGHPGCARLILRMPEMKVTADLELIGARARDTARGFTLIELLVVIAIIAIRRNHHGVNGPDRPQGGVSQRRAHASRLKNPRFLQINRRGVVAASLGLTVTP